MKFFTTISALLIAALGLAPGAVQGQAPAPAPELHQCVKPVPREGQGYQRYVELNQRVRDRGCTQTNRAIHYAVREGNGKEVQGSIITARR